MGEPPARLARDVEAATRRLLDTAATFGDDDVRASSRLPGWTRGHVLTHVARNADGLVNLLGWVHGSPVPMYESREARNHDIDAGAERSATDQLADLRASADRFAAALEAVPEDGWDTVVEWVGGRRRPTSDIPWARLVEIEVHHVDLGVGYRHRDWPERFAERLLDDLVRGLPERPGAPSLTVCRHGDAPAPSDAPRPLVTGPTADLAAWLAGRSDGSELTRSPAGDLPPLPAWI